MATLPKLRPSQRPSPPLLLSLLAQALHLLLPQLLLQLHRLARLRRVQVSLRQVRVSLLFRLVLPTPSLAPLLVLDLLLSLLRSSVRELWDLSLLLCCCAAERRCLKEKKLVGILGGTRFLFALLRFLFIAQG